MTAPRIAWFNNRVLAVILVVALPVSIVAGGIALGLGQSQLRNSYGEMLGRMAAQTSAAVDAFVFRRIIDVSTLAKTPLVRDTSETESGAELDPDGVAEIDRNWRRHVGLPPDAAVLLDSPTSRFLHEVVSGDPIYRELLVADRRGRLVAASGVTSDYYQGDEYWWREVVNKGLVSVTDVAWDESAEVFALEVAAPIEDHAGGVTGVLKAVIDTRELFAAVTGVRSEGTGTPALVRTNGSIVFSRQSVNPDTEYFASALLRDHLQGVQPGDAEFKTYFRAPSADGQPQLVALAPSQIARSFPELPWLVAVSESERILFAPVRAQGINLLIALGLVALVFGIVAVWWSASLAAPPDPNLEEMKMRLEQHARVHRIDEGEERAG